MKLKVYEYAKCDTCRKALKFLTGKNVPFDRVDITQEPPSLSELKLMLGHIKNAGGNLKDLFNTSGILYRELKISEKLKAGMSESEALALLAKNGKLIKRPFVLFKDQGTVGFKENVWNKLI